MITLKKYPNRRIYDTSISEFITLDDVREMLLTNEPFVVVESRSGQDITRNTLLQILFDIEQDASLGLLSHRTIAALINMHSQPEKSKLSAVLEQLVAPTDRP
jgi:polyhydroxyalkanoate synthesis repressor PhaR